MSPVARPTRCLRHHRPMAACATCMVALAARQRAEAGAL